MISLEAFSQLLSVLYAAPLQPSLWEDFLTSLCNHTQSRNGFLLCADARHGLSLYAQGGGMVLTSTDIDAYREIYAPKDPYRIPVLLRGRTGVQDCEALVPRATLESTDMFRDLIAPAGLRHPSLIVLTCSIRRLESVSFWRSEEEGPMDEPCIQLLNLLEPHIRSALEIRQVLGIAHQKLSHTQMMANVTETATFVVNAKGQILEANSAAEALLISGKGLRLEGGILVASAKSDRQALRDLIRSAATAGFSQPALRPAKALSVSQGSSPKKLSVLASPIASSKLGQEMSILLLAGDPDRQMDLPDESLRSLYGLTRAEIDISNGLLTGYSLEEISILRRVGIGTIRSQLKSIFSKTETRSQRDLIRVLLHVPRFPHVRMFTGD
jgi:DNA-binding CsgD family transcriptional regulator